MTTARLKGLEQDLGLTGGFRASKLLILLLTSVSDLQYDTVVAILYASYCPAQIPSNMARIAFSVLHAVSSLHDIHRSLTEYQSKNFILF